MKQVIKYEKKKTKIFHFVVQQFLERIQIH